MLKQVDENKELMKQKSQQPNKTGEVNKENESFSPIHMIKFHCSIRRTGSDVSFLLRSLDKCELGAQLRTPGDPGQQLCKALT